MNTQGQDVRWIVALVILNLITVVQVQAQTRPASKLPDGAQHLLASAKGHWTSYGLNSEGEIVKRFEYPDELTTMDLKVEDGRVSVDYTAKMQFPGREEPFIMRGKEGYYLQEDGTLGDYFTEQFGQVVRYKRLSEGVWAASTPAYPQELEPMGFANVISANHVMIKVISQENNMETHRISRITTVHWKEAGGQERWKQFTSIQGQHDVIPTPQTQ